MRLKPKIFISYAHADEAFVVKLVEDLRRHGADVWRDADHIAVGDSISTKIEEAIGNADFLLLVLSSTSITRPWVQREYRAALSLQLSESSQKPTILPLVIEVVDLPLFLRDIKYADFSIGYKRSLEQLTEVIGLPTTPAPFQQCASILGNSWDEARGRLATLGIYDSKAHDLFRSLLRSAEQAVQELSPESVPSGLRRGHWDNVNVKIDAALLTKLKVIIAEPIEMCYWNNPMSIDPPSARVTGCESLFQLVFEHIRDIQCRTTYVVPARIEWEGDAEPPSGVILFEHRAI